MRRVSLPDAEHLLLDILDTIRQPLLVLDPEFRVIQTNSAFYRTFLVDHEDTVGTVLFALGEGQWDIPRLHELLRDKLSLAPHLEDFDVDHVFPSIGRKVMLLNARVISRGANAPRLILLAIEDITDRRFTEWRLAEHARELERSNAALDEFASVASHDLQEPLRKLMSFGELLEAALGQQIPEDARSALDRMLDAAARMRSLVRDVLVYSQVTTRVLPFTNTDLSWIVREVLVELEADAAQSGAQITVGPLPVIQADALQMQQLIQNLLGNAIKYRRPGTRPHISVRVSKMSGDTLSVSVTDDGIGFAPEYAEQIFLMFERLHSRTSYPGTGIGLAICRRIVERHSGTITATSIPGRGSTFTFTLPLTHAMPESAS